MQPPHDVTRAFEAALCEYTGASYAVTTTSCTQAILMALAWWRTTRHFFDHEPETLLIPRRTYVGVPASIVNAGFKPSFAEIDWSGEYRIGKSPVWDSARCFTSNMFRPGIMQCVSFHATKILADSQGGAILLDNAQAAAWLRRARFDGRAEGADPKTDQVQYPSWHAYMSPDVAARLLWRLQGLPRHNADLPRSDYPDLSTMEAFR